MIKRLIQWLFTDEPFVARVKYADGSVRYFTAFDWGCFSRGLEEMESKNLVTITRYE